MARITVTDTVATLATHTAEDLREAYRGAVATRPCLEGHPEHLATVDAFLARLVEAGRLVVAQGRTSCDGGCFGGQRLLSGCIENGKPKGAMGTCYRCGGKGYQVPADVKRNRYYDNHVRRVYA